MPHDGDVILLVLLLLWLLRRVVSGRARIIGVHGFLGWNEGWINERRMAVVEAELCCCRGGVVLLAFSGGWWWWWLLWRMIFSRRLLSLLLLTSFVGGAGLNTLSSVACSPMTARRRQAGNSCEEMASRKVLPGLSNSKLVQQREGSEWTRFGRRW